jgi:hypothetical protein
MIQRDFSSIMQVLKRFDSLELTNLKEGKIMPKKKIRHIPSTGPFIEGAKGYRAICIRCGQKTYTVMNAADHKNYVSCCRKVS